MEDTMNRGFWMSVAEWVAGDCSYVFPSHPSLGASTRSVLTHPEVDNKEHNPRLCHLDLLDRFPGNIHRGISVTEGQITIEPRGYRQTGTWIAQSGKTPRAKDGKTH